MWLRRGSSFLKKSGILIIGRHYSDTAPLNKSNLPPRFISQLAHLLEIDFHGSKSIVSDHRKLLATKFDDIEESVRMLQSMDYPKKDLRQNPTLLYTSALTLENRHRILQECGFLHISAGILAKYIVLMNREIRIVKLHGLIAEDTNVYQFLAESVPDVELSYPPRDDSRLLKSARELILNLYLKEKLKVNQAQIDKLWRSYHRVRHKSLKSVHAMVEILMNELNFSEERIIKNAFVLYADPVNVQSIIDKVQTLGDEDIREVLYRRPKIMMVTSGSLQKTIEHITAFGVDANNINKCLDVLTLGSDTVLERLQEIDSVEEFKVLKSNKRILRLVHYQTKARQRLEYLNQLKVKCASLNVLSSDTDVFKNFTKNGSDKAKGCDTVNYLSSTLKRSPADVRDIIARHPNWCHVPVVTIRQALEFLTSKMFSHEDIFPNMQILLYPVKRINEKLVYLQNDNSYNELKLPDINCTLVSNQQMLALCLYLIELEFHFTGDGIWTEQDLHPVENFNSILPDFPDSWKKGFKYGTKPPSSGRLSDHGEIEFSSI